MKSLCRLITAFWVVPSLILLVACGGAEEIAEEAPLAAETDSVEQDFVEFLAPIDSVSSLVADSFPPQYFLLVESGLPHGCAQFDRYEVKIEGTLIQVAVINREPAEGAVGCSAQYQTVENQIPLGSDLLPDTTYTLLVNEVTETLVTQVGAPAEEAAVEAETTGEPGAVPEATDSPAELPTEPVVAQTDGCSPPTDWYSHLIVPGETMFELSVRAGSTVEELAAANCIEDPTQLVAGEAVLLPAPVAGGDTLATEFARFYLVAPGDGGLSGPPVGCGDSVVPVSRARPRSGVLAEDIRASLEELFAIEQTTYGQSGLIHTFPGSEIAVTGVALNDLTLAVTLSGDIPLAGVCADPLIEAQILYTLFEYQDFESALIIVDGQNLRQLMDQSGTVTADALYLRQELLFQ